MAAAQGSRLLRGSPADIDKLRVWEVPGTAHADSYVFSLPSLPTTPLSILRGRNRALERAYGAPFRLRKFRRAFWVFWSAPASHSTGPHSIGSIQVASVST